MYPKAQRTKTTLLSGNGTEEIIKNSFSQTWEATSMHFLVQSQIKLSRYLMMMNQTEPDWHAVIKTKRPVNISN